MSINIFFTNVSNSLQVNKYRRNPDEFLDLLNIFHHKCIKANKTIYEKNKVHVNCDSRLLPTLNSTLLLLNTLS